MWWSLTNGTACVDEIELRACVELDPIAGTQFTIRFRENGDYSGKESSEEIVCGGISAV